MQCRPPQEWKCHAQKWLYFNFGLNFHRFDFIVLYLISFTSNCGRDSGDGRKPGVAIGQLGLQVQTGAVIQPQRLTLKSLPRNSNFQTSRFLFRDDDSSFSQPLV